MTSQGIFHSIYLITKYKIDYEVVVRIIEAVLNLKVAFIY